MKALISINFALEIDHEDELITVAQSIDQSMLDAMKQHFTRESAEVVDEMSDAGLIDWYGVSISLRKSVLDMMPD